MSFDNPFDVERGLTATGCSCGRHASQADHDRAVLADRIEHDRVLKLGRHLADDVDALGLELLEVGEVVTADTGWG